MQSHRGIYKLLVNKAALFAEAKDIVQALHLLLGILVLRLKVSAAQLLKFHGQEGHLLQAPVLALFRLSLHTTNMNYKLMQSVVSHLYMSADRCPLPSP